MKKSVYRFILINISIVSAILISLSYYMIKTVDNSSVKDTVKSTFNNVEAKIDANNNEYKGILEQVSDDNVAKAKSMSLILNNNSNAFNDSEYIEEMRVALQVEEILITNKNGIVIAGTAPYTGQNFSDDKFYRQFIPALNDKSFVKVVNTSTDNDLTIHTAVSRLDQQGIIYISSTPDSIKDAVRLSGISTTVNNQYFIKNGELAIINKENWEYISHTDPMKSSIACQIDKRLFKNLDKSGQGSFKQKINNKTIYNYYREYDNYVLLAQIDSKEIYLRRNYTTVGVIITLVVISLTAMLSIRKKIIDMKID